MGSWLLKEYRILNDTHLNKLWKSGYLWKKGYLCCWITTSLVYIFPTNLVFQVKIVHWKTVFRKFYYRIVQVLSNWFSNTCVVPGPMLFLPPVPSPGREVKHERTETKDKSQISKRKGSESGISNCPRPILLQPSFTIPQSSFLPFPRLIQLKSPCKFKSPFSWHCFLFPVLGSYKLRKQQWSEHVPFSAVEWLQYRMAEGNQTT